MTLPTTGIIQIKYLVKLEFMEGAFLYFVYTSSTFDPLYLRKSIDAIIASILPANMISETSESNIPLKLESIITDIVTKKDIKTGWRNPNIPRVLL
jgi:hypothetical protein